jgi:predicted nucleic acid-binding Zn ribbon protein
VCGGKVKKLISSTSFQLKGGGWFKDGYHGGSSKKSGSSSDACSGCCETKCETKKKE